MKRNLFSWSLAVVFALIFMASVSYADVLAIRSILGFSNDMVSTQSPVAQFAINRLSDTPRSFPTDEIVGNSADDSVVLLPPATDQILNASSSSENFVLLLVVYLGEDLLQNDLNSNPIVPAMLPLSANGLSKGVDATTIVLEVRVPTDLTSQIPQQRVAGNGLHLVSPEPASFRTSRELVSIQDYPRPMEISRARGPVK